MVDNLVKLIRREQVDTCSRRISFSYWVSYYPVVPGEKVSAVMFCKQLLAFAVHIDLCYHSIINIQICFYMHLYDDIGNASSSLRGSTSSLIARAMNGGLEPDE